MKWKDLQAKVMERTEEALKKKISSKAATIARYFGVRSFEDDRELYSRYTWKDNDMEIVLRDGSSVNIKVEEKVVYKGRDDGWNNIVDRYNPGKWEEKIERYYPEANRLKNDRERKEKLEKEREEREEQQKVKEDWGLS